MKKFMMFSVAAACLTMPALAAPIDGTWVADAASVKLDAKPKVRSLVGGVYRCVTCAPAYAIPADGKFHLINKAYGTEQSVRVVDARTVAFAARENGREITTRTATVSADGRTLRWDVKDIAANGTVTTGASDDIRLAPGPRGSHAISGSWRSQRIARSDAKAMTMTFKEAGGMLSMSTPTGEGYEAKLGGPAVAMRGDTTGSLIQVRKAAPNSYVETVTHKGKVVEVNRISMTNPRTVTLVSTNLETKRTNRWVAHRQ